MSVTASALRQWFFINSSRVLHSGGKSNPQIRSSYLRRFLIGTFSCRNMGDQPAFTEPKEELKKRLTPIQYHVTQEKGTERAFTGKFNKCKDIGIYSCVVCNQDLFSSATKFESGCGWPSFNDVIDQGKVKLSKDTSHGMVRTEVTCSFCGAHLGHVFNDGPKPTRRRFCINSASLNFRPATEANSGS